MRPAMMISNEVAAEVVILGEEFYEAEVGRWIEGDKANMMMASYYMSRSEERTGAYQVSQHKAENGVVAWLQ